MDRKLLVADVRPAAIPYNVHGMPGRRPHVGPLEQEGLARPTEDGRQLPSDQPAVRHFLLEAIELRPKRIGGSTQIVREHHRRRACVEQ